MDKYEIDFPLMVVFQRYSQENTVVYSIQYKNGCLAAFYLFCMFTQSIKFYTFHYSIITF